MSVLKDLGTSLVATFGPSITDLGTDALDDLSDKLQSDDRNLEAFVVDWSASWVRDHGQGALQDGLDLMDGFFAGKAVDLSPLMSARELTTLTDLLQTAEAEDKARAKEWTRHLGAFITDVAGFLGKALVGAL